MQHDATVLMNVRAVVCSRQPKALFWTAHPCWCVLGKAPATGGPEQMYKRMKTKRGWMTVNAINSIAQLKHFNDSEI